jgi:RimJ/RimL family protein N-acetyltransferase
MKARLLIEPLRADHLSELAACLRHPQVYEHIGGLPSREDFVRDRERALRGPGPTAPNEHWLNFLVRDGATHEMLGRLEATLHDSIAEVAFLLGPKHWGKGHASEALAWLHREIQNTHAVGSFWATTLPANTRCQALLLRSGYRQVQAEAPLLYSYDPGDLVFHLRGPARGSVQPSPV